MAQYKIEQFDTKIIILVAADTDQTDKIDIQLNGVDIYFRFAGNHLQTNIDELDKLIYRHGII